MIVKTKTLSNITKAIAERNSGSLFAESKKHCLYEKKTHQSHRVYPKPFGEFGNKAMVSATKRSPGVRALAAPVRDSKGNVVVDYRNEFANFRIAEL